MKKSIVAFGEIMLRLTPPDKGSIKNTDSFCAYYGGSESNVLVALSSMGNSTKFVSQVSDNDLGEAAIKHLNSYKVDTSLVKKSGENLGMYFLEEGFGDRSSKVIYSRKNASITHLEENDFDFDEVFLDCEIFHISGISFALSESVKRLCFRLLKEAKKRNVKVSFDFNYRSKLWSCDEARKVFLDVVPYADIVFCSEKDINTFLDTDLALYFEKYPGTEYLVVREREIISLDMHKVKAVIYTSQGKVTNIKQKEFSVLERIGSGDAFAAGVLNSLRKNPNNMEEALEFGIGCFVLKHTVKGDVFSMSENEICSYIDNSLKDVAR
ncbi:MAG: sugar kinase [Clostridia bacterium]|nr:sugar kinase [Clostridia bacterium]